MRIICSGCKHTVNKQLKQVALLCIGPGAGKCECPCWSFREVCVAELNNYL